MLDIKIYKDYLPKPKNPKILENYWNFLKKHSIDIFDKNQYTENHHCVPRSYLKTKKEITDKRNIIKLKARDHYTAHLLLWLAFRDKLSTHAFACMNDFKREKNWKINSKLYEQLKKEYSKHLSESLKGKPGYNIGRIYITNTSTNEHKLVRKEELILYLNEGWIRKGPPLSENQKKHLSKLYKGENNPSHRHECKKETLLKRSRSMSNLIWITNGSINKRIKKEKLDDFLNKGFTKGRCNFTFKNPINLKGSNNPVFGSKWITNGKINKLIKSDKLYKFLLNNPEFYIGMTDNRNHFNTKRIYKKDAHWYNDGVKNYFITESEYLEFSKTINLYVGRYQFTK